MKIQDKIKSREEIVLLCEAFRRSGKTVGFTSGAFDLLHAGHADYLERAHEACDHLIVGVNSDNSVRNYKGENRPVIPQKQRAEVVAALESVDLVFIFNERRNKVNIELLRPDFYIKAGDYSAEKLTSKETVEKHGGKALIIPVKHAVSTTEILSRCGADARAVEEQNTFRYEVTPSKNTPVIFLDRDGTINEDIGYLHEPEKFRILPNVMEGLKKLAAMEYRFAVVTNQPGIGFGYYTKEDFYAVNRTMLAALSKNGIMIEKTYFCGHSKSENCSCRKPEPALIKRGLADLQADPATCWMIGDHNSDVDAGKRAGVRSILLQTGHAGHDDPSESNPDYVAKDLLEAAEFILSEERKRK